MAFYAKHVQNYVQFIRLQNQSMIKLSLILLCLVLIPGNLAAYCHGQPGAYFVNNEPIWNSQPRLLKTHQYGKLYEIGQGTTAMKMLHVYGNMYQMGFAQGSLLKEELTTFMAELWKYIEDQVVGGLPKKIPKFLQDPTASFAAGAALDLTFQITKPYTNNKYYQEMRGLADASGVPYIVLRRLSMIGQLTKGACSMFGAWGNATSLGQTVQLRALDWDFDGPYRKYPLVIVYHPQTTAKGKYGNAWMNIGFAGWLGVISGVNQHKMAVSQIGVSYPDETFGKESRVGNPFTFVLRDVLQWDKSIQNSIARMKSTKRTCNLILGVGDGKQNGYFRSFQYSHSVINVINDTHPLPKNDTWHPALQNTVYHGMDWGCPPFYARLHELLQKHHGNITAQNTMQYIVPGLNSGNLQAVVYDLSYEKVYIAYGYVAQNGTKINAYNRPYIGLDLKKQFSRT